MTRPTQIGPSRAILQGGAVGYDPDADTEDLPDPEDRALDIPPFYPTVGVGSGDVVQDDVSSVATGSSPSITTNFGSTPTAGNTLMAWVMVMKNGVQGANVTPSGWTKRNTAPHHANGGATGFELGLYTKVSDGTETGVTIAAGASTAFNWATLYIAEVGGSFGGYVEDVTFVNTNSPTLPSITPTAGIPALIMAAAVATNAYAMTSSPSGYGSPILNDDNANFGSSGRLTVWKRVENPTAGSYTGTVGYTGGSVTFAMTGQIWFSATLDDTQAPRMTDGDDSTYDTNTGTDVLRIALDDTYRIVRARLRIATENAGSRTYRIFGANAADYSDEVELDSTTFTALGSYSAQDVSFNWTTSTAYQYYRLEGDAETRRIHSFELYEAPQDLGSYATLDELDAHVDDTTDAHDASAISIADAGGFFAETDIEGVLQKLGLGMGMPTAPVSMRYTFSTTTTDADPGAGTLRLSNASQYLAVTIRADLTDADGADVTALLDVIATAGSGLVRLQKRDDPTKWLVATLSASASPSGYRNLTIANIAKSANSPFANGDPLIFTFASTGGGGAAITVLDEGGALSTAATSLDFVGSGVVASGTGAAKTITVASAPAAGFIGCRAGNTAGTVIANNTPTAMPLASEDFDSDGFHSTVTNNSRMTIPAGLGGKYLAIGQYTGSAAAIPENYALIRKNGTTDWGFTRGASDATLSSGLNVSTILDLVPGDYVELIVHQKRAGGATDALEPTAGYNWFAIVKLDSGKVGAGIGARVYNSAAIAANPTVTLTFNSERSDSDGFHSTSVNTGRLTIPAGLGGKYVVNVAIAWAFHATGYRQVAILLNGTTNIAIDVRPAETTGQDTRQVITAVWDFVPGDYVEVVAVQTSGGSLNVLSQSAFTPEFSIARLDSGGSPDLDDFRPPIQTKVAVAVASSLAPVFGITPQSTSLFLCQSTQVANRTNISSISQTNVTWTVVDTHNDAGTGARVEVWKGVPSGAPGATVTITYAASTNVAAEISEWPASYGLAGTIDGTSGKATATAGTNPSVNRTVTMLPGSLLLTVYGCNNGGLPAMLSGAPFPWLTPLRQTSGLSFWAFGYQWVRRTPESSNSSGAFIGVYPASIVWAMMQTAIK